jgi:C4-dicarboxylate-specific signal transduction histidine kinase
VEIEIDIPEDFPIGNYPAALEQILVNLLENSLVHGFAASARGMILIAASVSDGQVAVEYSDDGCGMTADVGRHAFDPFFTTRLGQGESGLGLYFAHNLAAGVLGGRIELMASEGEARGVRFRILLPQRL